MKETCGTCRMHSPADACCTLTGETRRKRDPACTQWTDGKADNPKTKPQEARHE